MNSPIYTLQQTTNQKSRLCTQTEETEIELDGRILEKQISLPEQRCLIIVTEDTAYDEALHIYLLNPDHSIADAIEASSPLTPAIFKAIDWSHHSLTFSFYRNEEIYQILYSSQKSISLPLPLGFRYKKKLSRHHLSLESV